MIIFPSAKDIDTAVQAVMGSPGSEAYEIGNALNDSNEAVRLLEMIRNQIGEPLSVEDLSKRVEIYLVWGIWIGVVAERRRNELGLASTVNSDSPDSRKTEQTEE